MGRSDLSWAHAPAAQRESGRRGLVRVARFALGVTAVAVAGLALASTISGLASQPPDGKAAPRDASGLQARQGAGGVWEPVAGAEPRFALAGSLFDRAPDLYSARRHSGGGGRLDQMAFGSPHAPGAYLRLTFYHPLDEPISAASFWLEMARRAGEAGLALERAPPVPDLVSTRLGEFEIGALAASGPQGPRACLGFRRQWRSPEFVMSGIACIDGDPQAARAALVCALEAVTFAGGADDPELAQLFASSAAPAPGCARGAARVARQRQR